MEYAMLIYETEGSFDARSEAAENGYWAAWRTYHQALVDAGVYVRGSPLQQPSTATTVRLEDGTRRVQDGPFANTKEQLGGFIVLELPSLREAVEWAARCPAAAYATVEIRPVDRAVGERLGPIRPVPAA